MRAIKPAADLYHSLGAADQVWLPANDTTLTPGIRWDSSHVFSIGAQGSVLLPGNDGATVHNGPSNDLIDGAYQTRFGDAPSQVGDVVFTNGDTVDYTGSFKDYAIKELTGGHLEVKDNRGVDGTDILKNIAFLKFDGDGTHIPAPGRDVQTVSDASARAWLQSHPSPSGSANAAAHIPQLNPIQTLALNLIHDGGNMRWAADATNPNHYTITWSIVRDPSKLPADYLTNNPFGVSSLTPPTGAAYTAYHNDIVMTFAEIHSFLPNVTFQEVHENAAADPQASAHGLGDVGTIRFLGLGDIPKGFTVVDGRTILPSNSTHSSVCQATLFSTDRFSVLQMPSTLLSTKVFGRWRMRLVMLLDLDTSLAAIRLWMRASLSTITRPPTCSHLRPFTTPRA
jgi:hypothetical protein